MTKSEIISLIDLTSLNEDDTEESIRALCQKAQTPFGNVAAVCVSPKFIGLAKSLLRKTHIQVATVNNFPKGLATADEGHALADIDSAIAAGADEIDTVIPLHLFSDGQGYNTLRFIQACRKKCAPPVKLKVIIESGLMNDKDIRLATRLCVAGRADFVKTSTGKVDVGATPAAVQAMCEVIKANESHLGIKISGGVRSFNQARQYLDIITHVMGPQWVSADRVRFGTSKMLDDVGC